MNFTVGLILLFLNVFLPGMLFLRFYFSGEFRKQFSTRIPMIRLAFYAFLPGFIFQMIGICIYDMLYPEFCLTGSFNIFYEIINDSRKYTDQTNYFFNKHLHVYIIYISFICIAAGVFGFAFHSIIRRFDLDIKIRILRFRNYWYYLLSGDIQRFKKYKNVSFQVKKEHSNPSKGTMMAVADILVSNSGAAKLYSGYVVDYELDSKDQHNLDKIYLLDVQKRNLSNEDTETNISTPILGDLFVLDYSEVINMNLIYIPLRKKEREQKKLKITKTLLLVYSILASLLVIFISIQLFLQLFDLKQLNSQISQLNFIQKLGIYSLVSTLLYFGAQLFYIKERQQWQEKQQLRRIILLVLVILFLLNVISFLFEYWF